MNLLIVGAGGHGKICAEIAELNGYSVSFLDDRYPDLKMVEQWNIVGKISDFAQFTKDYYVFIAIGCNRTRASITKKVIACDGKLVSLVHPSAQVSKYVKISKGVLISASAVINCFSELKTGCIINTSAVVEHDVVMGAFSHISPGAKLLGGCKIGEQTWIGSNAVVFPTIVVSDFVTLGALSIANNNLQAQGVFVGCPAKKIK